MTSCLLANFFRPSRRKKDSSCASCRRRPCRLRLFLLPNEGSPGFCTGMCTRRYRSSVHRPHDASKSPLACTFDTSAWAAYPLRDDYQWARNDAKRLSFAGRILCKWRQNVKCRQPVAQRVNERTERRGGALASLGTHNDRNLLPRPSFILMYSTGLHLLAKR